MEPHHSFFEAFGAASSINVNEYLTEMWDDPSSPRKSVQQWSDGTRSWWGVKQPRVHALVAAFVLLVLRCSSSKNDSRPLAKMCRSG
jgi:hypothetical protein